MSNSKRKTRGRFAEHSAARRALAYGLGAAAVLGVIIWAIYDRGIDAPFIFDDLQSVFDNPSIRTLFPLVGDEAHPGPLNPPRELPTAGRPLVNLSLAVNFRLGGVNPAGYHIFDIIVHWLSAVLLGGIIWRMLGLEFFAGRFERARGPLAFAVALLWAVHPLNTEAVLYVTQRTELMVGFFYLATLYASLRYWTNDSTRQRGAWLAIAALTCAAGMACKEVMVTAPVVILLFERTFVSGSFLKALRKSWPLYLALALGWLVLLALNFNAPRSRTAGFHLKVPPHVWWFTQAQVLWMYLKLVVWPWPLVIHYAPDYLDTLSAAWPWLLGAIVLAIACTFLFWRRYAAGFVGIAVLAVLSPTLVVPIVTEVAAERRMYLPLSAITALAVIGVYWLVQAWQARASRGPGRGTLGQSATIKAAVIGAAAVAVVLGLVSYARVAVMRDPVRLWSEAALYEPNDSLAHTNLGMELFRVNRVQDAIEQYREALRLNPGEPTALVNLAVALVVVGRPQDAIAPCEEAIRSHSDYAKAHSTLGVALAETGKPEAARDEYLEAIRLNPDDAETHCNLGLLLAGAGKPQEAIKQYQESLRLRPNYPKARYSLGVALMETGQVAEAVEQFVFTLRLKPDYVEAGANLAVAYAQLNRTPKAIRVAERTLNMARTQKQAAVEQQMIKLLAELQAKRRAGGAGE